MPRVLIVTVALLSLWSCNSARQGPSAPSQAAKPVTSEPVADRCGADKLGSYLNLLPTSDAMAKIEQTVGDRRIRTIRPGEAVTMDYDPDRLNVELGEGGRIKRFRCG